MRVSLARAFYANKDIYLLDDPISALDIHVGSMVMEKGLKKFLEGKTRIIATHALPYLKFFDYIYHLEDGEIIQHGTFEVISKSPAFLDL